MTPAHQQYWKMKSEHFDGVLFFKVGKFYELFWDDAELGVKLMGLERMNDHIPHVGFPGMIFDKIFSQTHEITLHFHTIKDI